MLKFIPDTEPHKFSKSIIGGQINKQEIEYHSSDI